MENLTQSQNKALLRGTKWPVVEGILDLPRNQPIVIQISLERNEMELSIKYISLSKNTHTLSIESYITHCRPEVYIATPKVIVDRDCKNYRLHVKIEYNFNGIKIYYLNHRYNSLLSNF